MARAWDNNPRWQAGPFFYNKLYKIQLVIKIKKNLLQSGFFMLESD